MEATKLKLRADSMLDKHRRQEQEREDAHQDSQEWADKLIREVDQWPR